MEVQDCKERTKFKTYNQEVGATCGVTLRLAEMTTGCGHNYPIGLETYIGDSWFWSLKTAKHMMDRNFHFIGQIKQNHRDFPKQYLEKNMELMAPGNWMVLENMMLVQDINGDLSSTKNGCMRWATNTVTKKFFVSSSPGMRGI